MKWKMSDRSLFAILLRSPWWMSFLLVAAISLASSALLPTEYKVVGALCSLPFAVIGAMAAMIAAAFVVNAYRRKYYGGLLVAPAIAVLFVMNIFPLLWSLGLSFYAYQSNQQSIRFVGLANYIKVLTNDIAAPANWAALVNTAMFVVLTVTAQMIVGFLLAMMFAKQFPLRKYLLILVLTPMMLSVVASGVFFTYYYDPTFGILSYVVNSITGGQFILMSSKVGAVAGIVFADAWMWSPFVMLLVLAGLVSVPKYLYEAAAIDRVSKWRQFWTITFPYIRGLLMLALLFRTIEAFKLADLVILLTKGGNDTMTISYHLIRIANEQNKTSEGAAISYLMLFMVIVLTNLAGADPDRIAYGIAGLYDPDLAPKERKDSQIDAKAFDPCVGNHEVPPDMILQSVQTRSGVDPAGLTLIHMEKRR